LRTALIIGVLACAPVRADVYVTEGTNISVDVAPDGRLAIDLLGGIWVLPHDGGDAQAIASGQRSAHRPRWSPDGSQLVFEANSAVNSELWLYSFDDGSSVRLGSDAFADRQPDWHPDGTRVIFSSARGATGFDLWEADIRSGLTWSLTSLPGDETEPAWSANGEDLVYIRNVNGEWQLVLRERGHADEVLVRSSQPIAAPGWRPDGSLLTYLQKGDDGWSVYMTILSQPRLTRRLIHGEDFFLAPIAWRDRQQMVYAADGHLKVRNFNSWRSRDLYFRANVGTTSGYADSGIPTRELPALEQPPGRKIIRAARVYDGIGANYLENVDLVVDGGIIAAIEARRQRDDGIVIDLGDATILPGYIDAFADIPPEAERSLGPILLSFGVTTLITPTPRASQLDALWAGKDVPGPRVLPAAAIESAAVEQPYPWLLTVGGDRNAAQALRPLVREWHERGVAVLADGWQVGLGSGATLLLGTNTRPTSPRGFHYQDVQLASGVGKVTFVSGLADSNTPGIADIWRSRQAQALGMEQHYARHFVDPPELVAAAPLLVVGSKPNGMPPGVALHAEFRALVQSGLRPEQVLRAAGVNAAAAMGFGTRIGRLAKGSAADVVIVNGDPVENIAATLNVIAVLRNGRFYSVSGLLDLADAAANVE
jgi:hypothetical protein